jgi:uncharacterized membrane protein
MTDPAAKRPFYHANFKGHLLAGVLTIMPLIVVWLVFDFLLDVLTLAGHPLAQALTGFLDGSVPTLKPFLSSYAAHRAMAVVVALLALYSIGSIASRMIGQRLIHLFERIITRIPLVETIYMATKRLVDVLRQQPGGTQRVVLIDFPSPGMKTLGFVTRLFRDARTGEELAAVYVPTAMNPTAGFLEVVPFATLIPTDIPTDQAMAMIVSCGAVMPDQMTISPQTGTNAAGLRG